MVAVPAMMIVSSASAADPLRRAKTWNEDRAAHLLRRAGFGGNRDDVRKLHELGLEKAVSYLVDFEKIEQTHPDPRALLAPEPGSAKARLDSLPDDERREVRQQLRSLNQAALEELRAWWIERMILTPRPFEEKMVLFWHGRFTSGADEVKFARLLSEQNAMLRKNAVGRYGDLLLAVCKDRAMLKYLDGDSNRKDHPNENFARELLELFTLGTGNYTEQDIKEAARAFTGWSAGLDGFRFRRGQHDFGEKAFLGRKGKFDGDDIVQIILEQPAASRHLARSLLLFFVTDSPSDELVSALAAKLAATRFDVRESLRALFLSEAFYADRVMFNHIKSPPEFIVGIARSLQATDADAYAFVVASRSMGQDLFQPPNVKGWDGGRAWINSATLYSRYDFIGLFLAGTPDPMFERRSKRVEELSHIRADLRDRFPDEIPMLTAEPMVLHRRQPRFDASKLLGDKRDWTADELATRLLESLQSNLLTTETRESLVQRLGGDATLEVSHGDTQSKIREALYYLMTQPEFQLN